MRKLLLIGLVLVLVLPAGCKKKSKGKAANNQPSDNQPAVHAPTGVVLNPGAGGGSGGAVQAVRKAVGRPVSQTELKNIEIFINASEDGKVPPKETILAALQKEAPKTYRLVQDKVIVLTGTRSREHIWAYTGEPQWASGEYLVLASSGIVAMSFQQLDQRLKQEQGR